jgi:DEAD/DEAH box helicase domain-containing protein
LNTGAFLEHVRSLPWYREQMTHIEDIPARDPTPGELERPLRSELQERLHDQGIVGLYSHQAEAIDAARRGTNVIVATPAASGKSICYHLPVLEALLGDRSATAMYLFPTKALAQDQAAGLERLTPERARLHSGVFDGDTPRDARGQVRRNARIVITNPDMLHMGMLPNHRNWYRLFRNLRYVVIDEAHVYRGVFGSHVANVIRRLRRLCARFGAEPTFILCSATITNPAEHAEKLLGLPVTAIENDGAPFGGKDFVLWNPPQIDFSRDQKRRTTNTDASLLMTELLKRRVRTLTFVRSRRMAELLYVYVRDQLKSTVPELANKLAPYRASYLAEDRRKIERDLFSGKLLGLTSTTAMELGIDVGDLDATILTGYPGSFASTWQQAGRSGRRGERALSVLVAQDDPLDQYLMRHPSMFFGKPSEAVRISPTNPFVLKPHLLCAAYEAPLTPEDADLFDTDITVEAQELVGDGFLHKSGDKWHLEPEVNFPAESVNIRSTSSSFYTLVDRDSGAILETVQEASAFLQLHPGAVYLHKGEPYVVADLDLETKVARAFRSEVEYYTQPSDVTETRILREFKDKPAGRTEVTLGEVNVTTTVTGFRRLSPGSGEVLGEEYVELPPRKFNTVGLWFGVPPDTLRQAQIEKLDLAGALHAIEHAAIGVLPLFAMCDRNDIGGISTPLHPDTGRPQVFIHDGTPGGVGIAEHGYDIIEGLWKVTLDAIAGCACDEGCPGCIHSPKCGSGNRPLDKGAAVTILRGILGQT